MPTKNQLLQDTVARPLHNGIWALMNKQETGLASSALCYTSLEAIRDAWDIEIGETGEDEHGTFVRVHRATPGQHRVSPFFAAIGVDGSDRTVLGVGDSRQLAEQAATDYAKDHPFAVVMRVVPMNRLQVARWTTGTKDPIALGLVP